MASFPRRIVLTGAESTGKTTLARQLGLALDLPLVAEFAREYAASRGGPLSAADVEPIARGQLAAQRAAPERAVLDTDLLSTWIYARHYYSWTPPWLEEHLTADREVLYLLCDVDLPWVFDSVRDPLVDRDTMHRIFETELRQRGYRWTVVRGSAEQRLLAALDALGMHS